MNPTALFGLHAHTDRFKRKVAFARECIEYALDASQSRKWALSLSLGKDSLCLYFLLLEVLGEDLQTIFLASKESFVIHDFTNVIAILCGRGLLNNFKILQPDVEREVASGVALEWSARRKEGHEDRWEIDKYAASQGCAGSFIGLRAEESNRRRLALVSAYKGHNGHYTVLMKDPRALGLWHSCPLAEWTLKDVGAMLHIHDVPLLAAYHEKGLQTRTTARATGVSVNFGNLVSGLKQENIGRFNELLGMFNELRGKD